MDFLFSGLCWVISGAQYSRGVWLVAALYNLEPSPAQFISHKHDASIFII
jgi:hypothetical protein